jgi:hypothetical protein
MPKNPIDNSNTFFYRLYCLDPLKTFVYVGHTTNFVRRKHMHKQKSLASTADDKNDLYTAIRLNGGWSSWNMEIIDNIKCADQFEARKKELEYVIKYKANLNNTNLNNIPTTNVATPPPPSVNETSNVTDYLKQENQNFKEMMIEMIKSNQELQRQVLDVCKLTTNNITTINTNNNTNNTKTTFNMQVFLNEHCKDAMNLKDFIDSMVLSLDDLELVGQKGFVDGISKIIVGNLRKTDVHMRPIHCSDAKREVMYIKENDKWEKEGPNNDNMRLFVQYIERKNIRLISAYVDEHPDCMDPESLYNDHYLMLTSKATCATEEHINKVISRICKEVLIDK